MFNPLEIVIITVVSGLFVAVSVFGFFVICVMGYLQKRNQDRRSRHVNRTQPRETETQEQENDDEEAYKTRILSEAPPPVYRNANQYQNVDLEHTEVARMQETYRISTRMEPETTSLPPDYTSERLSISVAPQEIQASEGQLPPTYSTAQLELMARRTATD